MIAGWIETRLWRSVSADDREFVLDVALLDRIEPELIEEATRVRNAGHRLASMGALSGLLSISAGDGLATQLHPLIKDYCQKRRFEETPQRFARCTARSPQRFRDAAERSRHCAMRWRRRTEICSDGSPRARAGEAVA